MKKKYIFRNLNVNLFSVLKELKSEQYVLVVWNEQESGAARRPSGRPSHRIALQPIVYIF